MGEAPDPARACYARRRGDRRRTVEALGRIEARLAYLRLLVFLVGAAILFGLISRDVGSWPWLVAPAVAFLATLIVHDRVIRRRLRATRAVRFYDDGLLRLDDRWSGRGEPGLRFLDGDHPYAENLDLFGKGSLFELLCRARTRSGEQTLARWLLGPTSPETVRKRQAAVAELRDRPDLREDLAVLGEDVRADDHPETLIAWAGAVPVLSMSWPVVVATALAIFNFAALLVWSVSPAGGPLFGVAAVVGAAFALLFRKRVDKVLGGVEQPEHELELLSGILARLEAESFRAPLLEELRDAIRTEGAPASRRIKRLGRLVQLRDSRDNLIFRPFAALMFCGTQLAFAMERWRRDSGAAVEQWEHAVGQIEALSSFAAAAFERPGDGFPEIVEQGPLFDAVGLGHPLLPESRSVRNDVRLDGDLQLLLVSGSNMSGKTTLLRTVGVNAVLAQAGATVRARALRISPLEVGACLRVTDSLQRGVSHFYAEITRLRMIFEVGSRGRPLVFLLDEILHGTNSRDRRTGAEALIRGLLDLGAIGLVTTHDLALVEIAEALAPRAANVHFDDYLEGDRIAFDYVLKPGVVGKSNALPLMRAVGLKV